MSLALQIMVDPRYVQFQFPHHLPETGHEPDLHNIITSFLQIYCVNMLLNFESVLFVQLSILCNEFLFGVIVRLIIRIFLFIVHFCLFEFFFLSLSLPYFEPQVLLPLLFGCGRDFTGFVWPFLCLLFILLFPLPFYLLLHGQLLLFQLCSFNYPFCFLLGTPVSFQLCCLSLCFLFLSSFLLLPLPCP